MKYIVEFDATRHFVNIFQNFDQMMNWCEENCVGEFEGGEYFLGNKTGNYKFELEEDAMAFKLRWV